MAKGFVSHHELAGPAQQLLLPPRLYGGLGTWPRGQVCPSTLSFQASWWKASTMPLFSTHAPAWETGAIEGKNPIHHTSKHLAALGLEALQQPARLLLHLLREGRHEPGAVRVHDVQAVVARVRDVPDVHLDQELSEVVLTTKHR